MKKDRKLASLIGPVGAIALSSSMAFGGMIMLTSQSAEASPVFGTDHTNIILIMADDMNAAEIGAYGHPDHHTPNLDQLAHTGTMFETFFVTPVCSPTRVALMTGKRAPNTGWYNMRNRVPGGIGGGADIATDEVNFGQAFERVGYRTAFAGKWQLTGNDLATKVHDMGFAESLIWLRWGDLDNRSDYMGGTHGNGISRYWHPGLGLNGVHIPTEPEDYGPDMFGDFIVQFIDRRASQNQPFFVYYPMALPHRPWVPTPDALDVEENSWEAFTANVEYLDKIVGRIVDAVDNNGIREKTLIIFLTDNGTQQAGKGTPTEFGARSAGIFNMPGTVKSGLVTGALAEVVDVFPTIAEYAGITLPEGLEIDGISLRPILDGTMTTHREYIYAPLGHYRVLRNENWLLEANTPERYGRLFYTGNRRDGLGYADVTDIDHPIVHGAMARMEIYMQDVPFPEYNPDDRFDFEEMTDGRINDLYQWIHEQEQRFGIEKIQVPGIDPALIPTGPSHLPPSR